MGEPSDTAVLPPAFGITDGPEEKFPEAEDRVGGRTAGRDPVGRGARMADGWLERAVLRSR